MNVRSLTKSDIIRRLRYLIIGWWSFWLLLASFLYGGLSFDLYLVALFSLLGFYLGSGNLLSSKSLKTPSQCKDNISIKIPIIGLCLIIAYQINLYLASLAIVKSLGAEFREAYYEYATVQGSSIVFVLYEQFLIPTALFLISLWVCTRKSGNWWAFFTAAFFILDASIKAGRFPLYFLVFFLVIGHFQGTFKLSFWRTIPIVLSLPALSIYYLLARGSFVGKLDKEFILEILDASVLKYHVVGFYILDNLMHRPDLQPTWIFPSYTFGYFEYLISITARRFNETFVYEYPQQYLNLILSKPIHIKEIGTYNAFATNILPFYLDGGLLFSFIMFFAMGLLVKTNLGSKSECLSPLNIIGAFVMMFGIFQPLAMTSIFFFPIILFFFYIFIGKVTSKVKA